MGKILDAEPAGFANNDASERESIKTLNYILDSIRAKPEISLGDKFPNIDGRITIASLSDIPIGEIQIQVKTLKPKNYNTPKHQCTVGFLSYCYKNVLPVVLIVVDKINCCAYWRHMTKGLIEDLDREIGNGESINVDIPIDNKITTVDLVYLDKWQEIIEQNNKFYAESLFSEKENADLKKQLQNFTNTIGIAEPDENVIIGIQKFLDYFNHGWDFEFNKIKSILYPSVWKFGLGYSTFTHEQATISIYPIFYSKNIVHIKKFIDSNSLSENHFFKMYYLSDENPILQHPCQFAYDKIQNDLIQFLEKYKLDSINKTIIKEYIFAFINEFHHLMGLELKDEYKIQEIAPAISETLFQNVHKIISQHKELVKSPFFNIDTIKHHVLADEIEKCLALPFVKQENIKLSSHNFNVIKIMKFLSFLNNTDEALIKKPFPFQNFVIDKNIYIFQRLSERDWEIKLQKCFEALLDAYNDTVFINFPNLEQQLSFFHNFDLLVVVIDSSKKDSIKKYMFKTIEEKPTNEIKVVLKTPLDIYDYQTNHVELYNGVIIEGKRRVLVEYSEETLNMNIKNTLLSELVHEELIKRLKIYFDSKTRKVL